MPDNTNIPTDLQPVPGDLQPLPSDLQPVPNDLQPGAPRDMSDPVVQGYERMGQLAQEGQAAQAGHAFAQAHPVVNAAMTMARASDVPTAMAGAERLANELTGNNATHWQNINQTVQNAPLETTTPGARAANLIGQGAGFVENFNPALSGLTSAAASYGNGESGLQALAHGAINYAAGKVLEGGTKAGAGEEAATITHPLVAKYGPKAATEFLAKQLAPYARPLIAKMGVRAAVGALTQMGQVGSNNVVSGRPFTEGLKDPALIGALGEAGFGAVNDVLSPRPGTTPPAENPTPPPEPQVTAPAPPAEPSPHPDELPNAKAVGDWYGQTFNDEKNAPVIEAMTSQYPGKYIKADVPLDRFAPSLTPEDTNVAKVARYAKESPETQPPIIAVGKAGEQLQVADGGHRLAAAALRGDQTIPAYVPEGSVERPPQPQPQPLPAPVPAAPPDLTDSLLHEEDPQKLADQLLQSGKVTDPTLARQLAERFVSGNQTFRELGLGERRQGGTPTPEQNRRFEDALKGATLESPEEVQQESSQPSPLPAEAAPPPPVETAPPPPVEGAPTLSRLTTTISQPSVSDKANAAIAGLAQGTVRPRGVLRAIFNGQSPRTWLGDIGRRTGIALANLFGGLEGRPPEQRHIANAITAMYSGVNAVNARMEAIYTPPAELARTLTPEEQYRLQDELEADHPVSDPRFRQYQELRRPEVKSLKEDAIAAGVPGAQFWNETQMLRAYAQPDAAGRAPWQAGYRPPTPQVGGESSLQGLPDFHRRSVEDGAAASAAAAKAKGLVPAYPDPITADFAKRMEMRNLVNAKIMANEAEAAGYIRKLQPGESTPAGQKKVNDRLFHAPPPRYSGPAQTVEPMNDIHAPLGQRKALWRTASQNGDVTEVAPPSPGAKEEYGPGENEHPATGEYSPTAIGALPEGHLLVDDALVHADRPEYVAPAMVADMLNNHLEPPAADPQNPIARAWHWINSVALKAQLGYSLFHHLNLLSAFSSEQFGAGVESLAKGRLSTAAQQFSKALPVRNVFEALRASNALHDALSSPEANAELTNVPYRAEGTTPAERAGLAANLITKGGGITDRPTLGQQEPSTNPLLIPQRFLFEKIAPALRRAALLNGTYTEMARAEANGQSLAHPDVLRRIQNLVQSTNDIFDTIPRDRNFQSRIASSALHALFAFPNWTISKARLGVRALGDIPQTISGRSLTPSQRIMAGSLMKTALAGGAITWAATGQPPKSAKDCFFPVVSKGGNRVVLPGPLLPLLTVAFGAQSLLEWGENRLSPVARVTTEFAANRDYRGVHTHDDVANTLNTIRQSFEPQWAHQLGDKESMLQRVGDFFGVRKTSARLGYSPAEREAHDILQGHDLIGGRTQAQAAQSDKISDLITQIRADRAGGWRAVNKAIAAGDISPAQRTTIAKRSKEGGEGLSGLLESDSVRPEQLMDVWEKMSADEKRETRSGVLRRLQRATSLRPAERRKYIEEVTSP
jgi:hypothetical protein